MTYIDGFVAAVPAANREAFLKHARAASSSFREFGATRAVDAWGDDVPKGEVTDFYRAVGAKDGEIVGFSFIEYADRNARDAAGERMMSDPRMADLADMPFDGKRMLIGGFELVVDEGPRGPAGYIEGFVAAVPTANRDVFVKHSLAVSHLFLEHGATRHVEGWGDDVMHGKVTDFHCAVKASSDETVIFSWIEWPDRATRDAGQAQLYPKMEPLMKDNPLPFDGKRMIIGGFEIIHEDRA